MVSCARPIGQWLATSEGRGDSLPFGGNEWLKARLWQVATWVRTFISYSIPAWRRYVQAAWVISNRKPQTGGRELDQLLLLAWEFPPDVTGGVYRPTSFVRHGAQSGWDVMVLSGPAPAQPSQAGKYMQEAIPPTVDVLHLENEYKGPRPWLLPYLDGGTMNALDIYDKAVAVVDASRHSIVLASGPPFFNFAAAKWLARRYGWPLVLDYRDEWTECPFGFTLKDETNRYWESECLKSADWVIFTTESQMWHQVQLFPGLDADKCAVIYNGWDPRDFSQTDSLAGNEGAEVVVEQFVLAFFGNLGPMAQPDTFLATLTQVIKEEPSLREHLRLQIVGRKSPEVQEKLAAFPYPEVLDLVDQVSKAEACTMMRHAGALLLLNPPTLHRYIQGKLYDYLASGTPVLMFGQGGEMAGIAEALEAGPVIDETADGLANTLRQLINREIEVSSLDSRADWLASRTREAQAERLLKLLTDLGGGP